MVVLNPGFCANPFNALRMLNSDMTGTVAMCSSGRGDTDRSPTANNFIDKGHHNGLGTFPEKPTATGPFFAALFGTASLALCAPSRVHTGFLAFYRGQ